jgi:hypothetical protein
MAAQRNTPEGGFYSSEWVAFVMGLIAWVLPNQEWAPLFVNIPLGAISLIASGKVVWKWEETRLWTRTRKIIILCVSLLILAGALVPGLQKQYEREFDSGVRFKEAPEFDWFYEFEIRREITKMHDYFRYLEIPVPEKLPPIGVKHGSGSSSRYEVSCSPDEPMYRQNILIGERDALEHNIRAFTDRYADYVMLCDMRGMLNWHPTNKAETVKDSLRFDVLSALGPYFNWSFWDTKDGRSYSPWSQYLWNIRERFGKKYTDALVANTVQTLIDNPNEGDDDNLDAYFCYHLKTAFKDIDNGARQWSDVVASMDSTRLTKACPAN